MNDDEHRQYLRKIIDQLGTISLLLFLIMLASIGSCTHTDTIVDVVRKIAK